MIDEKLNHPAQPALRWPAALPSPQETAGNKASHRASSRNPCNRRRGGGDRGAGAAEVVIAVPLLMLLILAIVQFALWAHASSVAQATAEEALAAARVQGSSAAAGQQRAQQVLGQIGSAVLINPQISVTRTAASATVQITATAEQMIPFLSLPVHVTVTGPIERFVPETRGFTNSDPAAAGNPGGDGR